MSRDDLEVAMDVNEVCKSLIALPGLQTKEIDTATKRNGKEDKGVLWSRLQQPVHPSQKIMNILRSVSIGTKRARQK